MVVLSEAISEWSLNVGFGDLPATVVRSTELRILDIVGLVLAGLATPFGAAVKAGAIAMHAGGPARLLGSGDSLSVTGAAFANGALSQALEFDDTHNESIVHMSGPAVAAAFALAGVADVTGRDIITAIAIGNEVSCRVGSVSPGQFHRRGFHPTGLFASFGTVWLAGRLMALDKPQMINAAGIVGSFASGLLQCWVDGTQSKFLHPGHAAESGIVAASLARAGVTGPSEILEGRFGMFASHLQDKTVPLNYERVTDQLGDYWESQNASFKPFPVAHVIHPYISALLRLRQARGIDPREVVRIDCPVAAYIVGIVCEPVAEKRRPRSDSHGRVSLQYTLAEALVRGRMGRDAYQPASLDDPEVLRVADCVEFHVDPAYPGPERFKGAVTVRLRDGTILTEIEESNRGSAANPMSEDEIVEKFRENTAAILAADEARALVDAILSLRGAKSAANIVRMTVGQDRAQC